MKHLFLDISTSVRREGWEEGLLGFAFHPQSLSNNKFYIVYSASNPRRNVLSELPTTIDGTKALIKKEQILLEIQQPYGNHNGGMIAFGPDGYLYYGVGDGGSGGDPHRNGQNLNTLLGKVLRIDVDEKSADKNYLIPSTNPFVSRNQVSPEIWAYGLRNPWRFSFDRVTGDLWLGDVGQHKYEEINIIQKGKNYGWNFREGKHAYRLIGRPSGLMDPIIEHTHDDAQSITGGYVYRGERFPELTGGYIYGDFITGNVWMLFYNGNKVTQHHLIGNVPQLSSFGEDAQGEIYLLSLKGQIYSLHYDR